MRDMDCMSNLLANNYDLFRALENEVNSAHKLKFSNTT